jgi:hypothetical protein
VCGQEKVPHNVSHETGILGLSHRDSLMRGFSGSGLAFECFLQDLRQSCLPFWHPRCVVASGSSLQCPPAIPATSRTFTPSRCSRIRAKVCMKAVWCWLIGLGSAQVPQALQHPAPNIHDHVQFKSFVACSPKINGPHCSARSLTRACSHSGGHV